MLFISKYVINTFLLKYTLLSIGLEACYCGIMAEKRMQQKGEIMKPPFRQQCISLLQPSWLRWGRLSSWYFNTNYFFLVFLVKKEFILQKFIHIYLTFYGIPIHVNLKMKLHWISTFVVHMITLIVITGKILCIKDNSANAIVNVQSIQHY